ncbi:MAG: GHMP kinase [Bdellovibrionales bacterium CG10_big_fil_rev_8_21_14_0_10_45_34]|nr:MAG: GHMP kinase [Bdellovibrionales bacterium CG10_big_fil_rev_8_21_14_0_10_45_34]
MIISRTPFRISFFGGGTDLPSFYKDEEGEVLSVTVNKYMYITVNDRFDASYRLSYSKTEIREKVSDIDHPILKIALTKYGPLAQNLNGGRGLEILSMADIPSGTGLGSSSSFTVGLLHALKAHIGVFQSAEQLAHEASHIEIEELEEPIGKQDQYAAAYGGLQSFKFKPDGAVAADPVVCSANTFSELESSILLFYTGMHRPASQILTEQKANTESKRETLRKMKVMAEQARTLLSDGRSISDFGALLDEGWRLKKTLASGVSLPLIDSWYASALKAGAWGGKLLGAGGGGFLMLLCPQERQEQVKQALGELKQVPVSFDRWGSKIIFVG